MSPIAALVARHLVLAGALAALLVRPVVADENGEWRYRLTPYLWVATLTGDLAADGIEGSTDSGYSFWALENLERYASVHFEARTTRWGWFVDALAVEYRDEFDNAAFDTALGVSGEILEAGAIFELAAMPELSLVAGARVIDAKVEVGLSPGPDGGARDRWIDPFVGLRYVRKLGPRWYLDVRGDLGGFGVSSETQVQLIASVGYRFSDRLEAFGGYRALAVDFEDALVLDVTAEGPGLGFTWSW